MNILKIIGYSLLWGVITYLFKLYCYSEYYDNAFWISNYFYTLAYVLFSIGTIGFITLIIGDYIESLWYKIKFKYNFYKYKKRK
jgi:hypothetical protein